MGSFIDDYVLQFPKSWQFNVGGAVDEAIKEFSRTHALGLASIKGTIIAAVGGIKEVLTIIPWFVIVLFTVFLAWQLTRKLHLSVIYGIMLTCIGSFGLWSPMLETLSIVIAGVVLSILFGFPLGILIAMSPKASRVIRPILDTMQTMPSWVYLVPFVMLFSVGMTPALFATTIYAVVPMIRLTSHGLLHVDKEMSEAAMAFGSTKLQALLKVQIPQAMPTIMAGVNQTIMMAMSMVVTCALIGASGLGMHILLATNRVEMGKALFPGISIVILAVILDRLTQAAVKQQQ